MSNDNKRVAICGAGLAGALQAILLRKQVCFCFGNSFVNFMNRLCFFLKTYLTI
jgi:hypothetical protein